VLPCKLSMLHGLLRIQVTIQVTIAPGPAYGRIVQSKAWRFARHIAERWKRDDIPAWGNAPGIVPTKDRGLKARSIVVAMLPYSSMRGSTPGGIRRFSRLTCNSWAE